jgi:hypothetical protein
MSQLNPTYGERRVGWFFEASGNDVADGVKTQCAALIDLMSAYRDLNPTACDKAQDLFDEGCKMAMKLLEKEVILKDKNTA